MRGSLAKGSVSVLCLDSHPDHRLLCDGHLSYLLSALLAQPAHSCSRYSLSIPGSTRVRSTLHVARFLACPLSLTHSPPPPLTSALGPKLSRLPSESRCLPSPSPAPEWDSAQLGTNPVAGPLQSSLPRGCPPPRQPVPLHFSHPSPSPHRLPRDIQEFSIQGEKS